MTKLKPCPFCGADPSADLETNHIGTYWVICDNGKDNCGCEGPYASSEEDAKARWNRRAEANTGLIRDNDRLRAVEAACKRLAYIVRKSVNSGPLSKDPTQEAEAWRQLRVALGEGYDERGNLVPIGEGK